MNKSSLLVADSIKYIFTARALGLLETLIDLYKGKKSINRFSDKRKLSAFPWNLVIFLVIRWVVIIAVKCLPGFQF